MTENPQPKLISAVVERGVLYDAIRAAELFMSGDFTRPHLAGILFEIEDGQLNLVATDGHRLILVNPKAEFASKKPKEARVLVDAKTVGALKKALRCKKNERDREVTVLADEAGLQASFDGQTVTAKAVDQTFPPYRKVIPAEKGFKPDDVRVRDDMGAEDLLDAAYRLQKRVAQPVGFTAEYLADVGKAFHYFKVPCVIQDAVTDSGEPIRFDGQGDDGKIVAVVMPRRY